ncbi:MAG TPA: hypothetical protein VKT49_04770 [Bryobacteraceae bacterium]|nr:hypothetical protein [Bryobacteraceae bacterium]
MHFAKITTPGLAAMTVSVAILWSCFIGEQVVLRNAAHQQTRVLYEMKLLRQRQRSQPASTPIPQKSAPARPVQS